MDGKVFDSSLSRDTLLVELGKRTVIAGNLQSHSHVFVGLLTHVCVSVFASACFSVFFSSSGLEQSLIGVCEG